MGAASRDTEERVGGLAVSTTLVEVIDWMRDAVAYAPAATGPGVVWQRATAPGFESLALCPRCSLRLSLRGCRPHPAAGPWTFEYEAPANVRCLANGCLEVSQ